MKLLKQDGPHCLLYSVAMILDCTPDEIRTELGYTGNEIWWPMFPHPHCNRSFHIQEMIIYALRARRSLTLIERAPVMAPMGEAAYAYTLDGFRDLAWALSLPNRGIIIIDKSSGVRHAVAYDGSERMIYDPAGKKYLLEDKPVSYVIVEYYLLGDY